MSKIKMKKFIKSLKYINEKVLVIGGAGFIGLSLTKRLSDKYEVHIIDNFQRGKKDLEFKRIIKKNIKLIKFDVSKKLRINHQYNYIFHLAAIVGKNVISKPYDVLKKT